jgi:hypothetical protein
LNNHSLNSIESFEETFRKINNIFKVLILNKVIPNNTDLCKIPKNIYFLKHFEKGSLMQNDFVEKTPIKLEIKESLAKSKYH